MYSDLISKTFLRIILTLIPLIISAGGNVMGQRYQTRTYTEADGLANSMIFDMVQDSSGVLWIGRRSGISSYDGASFYNYNIADGLRLASYSFLSIDEKESLWALPESGSLFLSRLEGNNWQTIYPEYQQLSDFIATYTSLDVYYDKGELVILIGTTDKGFIMCRGKQWRLYNTLGCFSGCFVNSVLGFNNEIYIATDKGLAFLENGSLKPVHDPAVKFLSGNILAMERQGNRLWLLGENGLGYLSNRKFTMVSSGFRFPLIGLGRRCFLHAGRNGKIYFGNSFKALCYIQSSNTVEQINRNRGLITEGGTSALVDREMNTWISGYRGITKINSARFSSLSENDGLLSNEVAAAIEASPGNYIFGHDGALTFYDGKTMSPFILDPKRKETNWETRVLDIQKDTSGDIWLAASSLGIARLNKKREVTWFRDAQGINGVAYTVAITPSGTIYAGTSKGLFIFINGRFNRMELGRVHDHSIRKVFSDPSGTIFFATFCYGLFMIKGNEVFNFTSADHAIANNVYAFFTDSKGRKWVGTAGGLYELAGKELKNVNRNGLMVNRPVYLILEDHLGNLWFGTDNGVFRWNGKALDHFTVNDGMSGHDINRAAGFMDHKNHIWFGTNNGLTVFKPEFDYAPGQIPPPKVKLLSVIAGKDSLDPNREKILPYDFNDLVFKTSVISLINERQNFVRFYLEGFDTGWSNAQVFSGNRFVYNNLRPGSYRFFIKAQNALGIWSDPVVSGTLYIQQPFWFRWWFITLVALLFTAITLITARYILLNRYKNRLKDEVSLRTAELRQSEMKLMESNAAKDSFFSIIAHDLRNPFNVILGYLDLLTGDDAEFTEAEQKQILLKLKSASAQTIDLLEKLLTWAQAQRGRLPFEPEFFILGEVITESLDLLETSAHSKNISMTIKGRQDLRVFADRNMIGTVVRNLISNALKFTFPGGTIIIGIEEADPKTIIVSVSDNGMGISPEILENLFKIEHRSVHKGTANETGTGLGLILCKEFIGKNGGALRVTSTHGSGSTFTFTLPSAMQ